jgi:hypothetical protein
MIKRFRFVTRRAGNSLDDFSAAWEAEVTLARTAPAGVAPLRAVACTVLGDVVGTEAPHDGIGIEWFADLEALHRFDAWLETNDGRCAERVIGVDSVPVFIAEEVVARGADWLTQRWVNGTVRLKHMALARRALDLSAAEFSQRWRSKTGTVGRVAIPDAAKGRAYVQNHPLPSEANAGRYDAVNEVYFDDLESVRAHIDFFAKVDMARAEAELVSATTFVAVAERVVHR